MAGLIGWLVGWLVGWLAGWLLACLVGWLAGWLLGRSVGRSVGWMDKFRHVARFFFLLRVIERCSLISRWLCDGLKVSLCLCGMSKRFFLGVTVTCLQFHNM